MTAARAPVEIRGIVESDLTELARFYAGESPDAQAGERGDPIAHLRWYLFENPAALADAPPGWVGRDEAGQIVGAKHCVPQRFRCGGETFTLLLGGGFYVNEAHRGLGMRMMREYLALGDRYSHFATTMNPVSGAIYERYGGYPIPGSDHELLGVLHWAPVAEEVFARRLGRAGVARWLAAATGLRPAAVRGTPRGELVQLGSVEEIREDDLPVPPEHAQVLTALRDRAFLHWRYFAGPDATRELFRYTGPGGHALVGVNRRRRGLRRQVRSLSVLDLWGALAPADVADVARALARRYRDEADAVTFRGLPETSEAALLDAGFVRRALPRATGVCIDRAGRLPTQRWYLVPADGDTGH